MYLSALVSFFRSFFCPYMVIPGRLVVCLPPPFTSLGNKHRVSVCSHNTYQLWRRIHKLFGDCRLTALPWKVHPEDVFLWLYVGSQIVLRKSFRSFGACNLVIFQEKPLLRVACSLIFPGKTIPGKNVAGFALSLLINCCHLWLVIICY